jgi:hypothetical protein
MSSIVGPEWKWGGARLRFPKLGDEKFKFKEYTENRFQPNEWQSKWKEYTECLDIHYLLGPIFLDVPWPGE